MMQLIAIKHCKYKTQAGLAAIEFVLILPILLILAFGVIDFGRLLFQYNTLTKSTRDATRYLAAIVRPPAAAFATDTNYTTAVNNARRLALCGTIAACGGNTLVSGLTAANITVDYPASVGSITYVRILVSNYSTSFLTNALGGLGTQNLGTISVTMRQVQQ
jgi:Flp pilus assembly protein TadG